MVRIFDSLRPFNNFHLLRINVTNHLAFSDTTLHRDLINIIEHSKDSGSFFIHGHVAHISFKRFGSSLVPVYINLLRDPLEVLVSKYYFIRFGDDYRPHVKRSRMHNNTERWQTFDECVRTRGRDCKPVLIWKQVSFVTENIILFKIVIQ